jgi:hypothetical protein
MKKQLESFLVNVQEHCFKKNKETNDFIKSVNEACDMANKMQVSVKDLPYKIQQMVNESSRLTREIRRNKLEKTMSLIDSNLTQKQLDELKSNGVFALNDKLRLSERQRAELMYTCSGLQVQLAFQLVAHKALAAELENCNERRYGNSKDPKAT